MLIKQLLDPLMVLDIELTPKMLSNFEPFELEEYEKVVSFIDDKHPKLGHKERLEMIDKLLFAKDE